MRQRLVFAPPPDQIILFEQLMEAANIPNKTAFFCYLLGKERAERQNPKRAPGRPRKDEQSQEEELPDENAKRTLPVPPELMPYVLMADRKKLLNEYDILMLRAKAGLTEE